MHKNSAQQQEGDLKDINGRLMNGACYGATSVANVADSPANMEVSLTQQEIAPGVLRLTKSCQPKKTLRGMGRYLMTIAAARASSPDVGSCSWAKERTAANC